MTINSSIAHERRAGVPQGLTVVLAGFLPILAIVSMFPAVPSIIDHFHADPTASWKVPWMVTAPGLAIAVLAPFVGILVDRFGRRKLLVWSTFFYSIIGLAPFFLVGLNALFASRILLGACEAVILTILNTLIGDYWDEQGRRHWLSIQAAIGPFLASGLILGSGFLTAMQWNGVFLVYLAAFPIFLAMLAFVFEPQGDVSASASTSIQPTMTRFPMGTVVLIGAVTLFAAIIFYVFIVNGGLAFREVGIQSPDELGKITFVPSLFVCLGAGVFWITAKAGSAAQLALTLVLVGLGYIAMGWAPNWKWMAVALCLQQTGTGMTVPSLLAWAQKLLPFEHRGRGMGVWAACFFLGQFVSPPCVALVKGAIGSMQGAFAAAGALSVVGALVVLLVVNRRAALEPAMAG
jgi:MFS family permease